MQLTSFRFAKLVAALQRSQKTCCVVEQCCGGTISASLLAQPGASRVFWGGSVVYNTKQAKGLLLNDSSLHESLLNPPRSNAQSEEDQYIASKKHWTAQTSLQFCKQLGTDFCIAEGGAAGPTFRPQGMTRGFAVLSVAGRLHPEDDVQVLAQTVVRGSANRQDNMRRFANEAAHLLTGLLSEQEENDTDLCHSKPATLRLERASHLRTQPDVLEKMQANAKFVILQDRKILVQSPTELALLSRDEMKVITDAEDTTQSFLGLLSDQTSGEDGTDKKTAVFGVDFAKDHERNYGNEKYSLVDTRTTAPLFSSIENEIALYGTALSQWHRRSRFCSLCGGATTFIDHGSCCQCTLCGNKSWPRQDPSMIAVISSRDGEKVLLAHSKRHPDRMFTVLAGFVEAGETFEASVAREAWEETRVIVDEGSVHYIGSQPWPFPQSCMIGFSATADDSKEIVVDDKEIESARWFDRSEVARAAAVPGATMQTAVAEEAIRLDPSIPLLIPPKGVIARRLIDLWLEGSGS